MKYLKNQRGAVVVELFILGLFALVAVVGHQQRERGAEEAMQKICEPAPVAMVDIK